MTRRWGFHLCRVSDSNDRDTVSAAWDPQEYCLRGNVRDLA